MENGTLVSGALSNRASGTQEVVCRVVEGVVKGLAAADALGSGGEPGVGWGSAGAGSSFLAGAGFDSAWVVGCSCSRSQAAL